MTQRVGLRIRWRAPCPPAQPAKVGRVPAVLQELPVSPKPPGSGPRTPDDRDRVVPSKLVLPPQPAHPTPSVPVPARSQRRPQALCSLAVQSSPPRPNAAPAPPVPVCRPRSAPLLHGDANGRPSRMPNRTHRNGGPRRSRTWGRASHSCVSHRMADTVS